MPCLVQINTTLNWGSTGRIAEQIAIKAEQKGWECHIAHGGRYIGDSVIPSIRISSKWDNYAHALYGELMGGHGFGSTTSTKFFIKALRTLNPDVIHLHNLHGYYLNIKVLFDYLAETRVPLVWTLHDCWSFTGHCTHFENAGCNKWETGCFKCPSLMAQYKSRIVDRSRKNYLLKKRLYDGLENVTIVPVSDWLGNHVSKSILKRFPMNVIHNGISTDVFKPMPSSIRTQLGIKESDFLVLGVLSSGINDEKGCREFIRLANETDYIIMLVGVEKRDKRIPHNIICVGRIDSPSILAEYYSAADVLLNPTYNDSFPTVNLESQSCGTPVITYRAGGSPETVDSHTGIVVEKGDFCGLLDALSEVRLRGKSSYSQSCRERIVALFDKEDRFEDYLELYQDIMTQHHQYVRSLP